MTSPVYSVVIPVYNSTITLTEMVERLQAVFHTIGEAHEVVFVDDASPNPDTWPWLKQLAETHAEVKALQLTRNFGKAGAVLCGMSHAQGQWIITMDDDLQHAPEDIPHLLQKRGHDVVVGGFANKKHHSLCQRVTSRIKGYFDGKILGKPAGLRLTSFHLYRAQVVRHMLAIQAPKPFIPALMFHATRDVVQVNVTHHPRGHGTSAFTFSRRLRQFANLIFGNSSFVLRCVAMLGVGIAALSLLYGAWLVISYFSHSASVPGWTSLMVVTLTLGGMIMFSIGVIGEYLIRILEGAEKRPAYLVRERVE